MNDNIYTLEEQTFICNMLDEICKFNEDQIILLGEDIKYDMFLEELTGGSVKRAVKKVSYIKNRTDKKVSKSVDGTVDAALDGEKKQELKSVREDIMRGRGKISTLLKRVVKIAIAAGVSGGAAPAVALLGFFFSTIRRRDISRRERDKIIFEMEEELEIVEEKIKDAESENNKKLKYQYMRIRSELKRNLTQLKVKGKIQQRD